MRIVGDGLTATVDPRRGAKITSLADSTGRQWLVATEPGQSYAPGVPFTDAEMAGWDECAPTINPCVVDGRDVPDHGDLWDTEFEVDGNTVTAVGASLDYRFHREISPVEGGLAFDYTAEARSATVPFLWAAHPQFVAPVGTCVAIDGPAAALIDVLDPTLPRFHDKPDLLSIDAVRPGSCRKVYQDPDVPTTGARLIRPDGAILAMRWGEATPYLGVWLDVACYGREPVIAIEPSTGFFDTLTDAVERGRVATLVPGRPLHWRIEVTVQPA